MTHCERFLFKNSSGCTINIIISLELEKMAVGPARCYEQIFSIFTATVSNIYYHSSYPLLIFLHRFGEAAIYERQWNQRAESADGHQKGKVREVGIGDPQVGRKQRTQFRSQSERGVVDGHERS